MALASASSSAVSCKHSLLSCYSIGQFLTNLAFFQPTVYKSLAGSNKIYYVAKDEANVAFWSATRMRKMDPFFPLGISRVGHARKISLLTFFAIPYWPNLFGQGGLILLTFVFFFVFLNKLGQQSIYPKARDVCQVHISELGVSMSSTSHIIAHSILIGSRKIRSYVTCRLV